MEKALVTSRGLLSDCENRWIVCSSSENIDARKIDLKSFILTLYSVGGWLLLHCFIKVRGEKKTILAPVITQAGVSAASN